MFLGIGESLLPLLHIRSPGRGGGTGWLPFKMTIVYTVKDDCYANITPNNQIKIQEPDLRHTVSRSVREEPGGILGSRQWYIRIHIVYIHSGGIYTYLHMYFHAYTYMWPFYAKDAEQIEWWNVQYWSNKFIEQCYIGQRTPCVLRGVLKMFYRVFLGVSSRVSSRWTIQSILYRCPKGCPPVCSTWRNRESPQGHHQGCPPG